MTHLETKHAAEIRDEILAHHFGSATSERAPSDPAGPLPVVGSGGVVGLPALSSNDEDILSHTSRTGRYVTDEADAADLARRGLLYDHGAQKLAGGMHYYTLSAEGRAALRAHRLAARPIPRQPEPNAEVSHDQNGE